MRIFTGEYGIIDGSLCGSYPIYRNANLIEGIVILSRRFKVWLFGTRIFLICPVRNASKEQNIVLNTQFTYYKWYLTTVSII